MSMREGVPWSDDLDAALAEALAEHEDGPSERMAAVKATDLSFNWHLSVAELEHLFAATNHLIHHNCAAGRGELLQLALWLIRNMIEPYEAAYEAQGLDPNEVELPPL